MSGEVWKIEKDLCRCCHSEGSFDDLDFFPSSQDGEDVMCNMLRNDLGITITPIEGELSTQTYKICEICKLRLMDATNFKRQVLLCEERFKDMYSRELIQGLTSTIEVKIEPADDFYMPEDINMDTTGADTSTNISDEEFKVETNEEEEEEEDSDNGGGELNNQLLETRSGGRLRELLTIDLPAAQAKPKPKAKPKPQPKPKPKPKSKPKATKAKAKTKKVPKKGSDEEEPQSTEETEETEKAEKADKPEREKTDESDMAIFKKNNDYRLVNGVYNCNRCDLKRKGFDAIRIHIRRKHYGLSKFECPHCKEGFESLPDFMSHKLVKHNVDDRNKCQACDATYNTKMQLKDHMNNFHMLEQKIKCDFCDYELYRKKMPTHMLVHTGVKKHKCKFCKKAFVRKSTLIFHERIHTGDRRHMCKVCEQAFVQKASLNYHMMKHHPEVDF